MASILTLSKKGLPVTFSGPMNIVAHGNSLTWGDAGGGQSPTPWPETLAGLRPSDTVTNSGVQGRQTPQLTAEISSVVEPLLSGTDRNIVIMWEGLNDMANGTDAATAWQNYVDYCAALSSSWEVYVMTVIPADQATNGVFQASHIDPFNALLRADYSFADGLIDIAADTYYQTFGPPAYQADRVHLLDAGYAHIATSVVDPFLGTI